MSAGRPADSRPILVLATSNRGKLAELEALLAGTGVAVVGVADVLGRMPHVEEDAPTFAGNALKKATAIAEAARRPTLADDSGLEVDALEGRPGVRSARFAHEHATDEENNAALLRAMTGIEDGRRGARYRCVLALVDRRTAPVLAEGTCEGSIARAPRGHGGFGYDPLFWLATEGRTMAELPMERRNAITHRARAVAALRPELEALLRRG
jgi:XTP/dITP diphosphohydrolase